MKYRIGMIVALLIVATTCIVIAQQPKTVRPPENGRFEIVNGTPDAARNIMLLDTQTGDSWIMCSGSNGVTGWCRMDRTYTQTGGTATP